MSRELFAQFLSAEQIIDDPELLRAYGKDWCRDFEASAALALLPGTYEEVQKIVQCCNSNKLALIPSGGRTGLSGGATATRQEIILSLERLNSILHLDPIEQTITCQAGAVTQKIQEAAADKDLYYPVDLGSAGSSQIGGNIATNAGGLHVIRYGSTRAWVLGLKVITGDGKLLELNGSLVKNQTGYDLRGLFIGSEGTLGIVIEATLRLAPRPRSLTRVLCGIRDLDKLPLLLQKTRAHSSSISAFEFFTDICLEYVFKHHDFRDPFEERYCCYGLIEFEDLNTAALEKLESFFFDLYEDELIADVVVSQNSQQAELFMNLRESIGETSSSYYVVHKNDLSVPISAIPGFLRELQALTQQLYPTFPVLLFGHVGDGNIHVNILKPDDLDETEFFGICHSADDSIFQLTRNHKGSISAEHGIGLLKKNFLHYTRTAEEVAFMKGIKAVFDPLGILNPGKIFDSG